MWFRQDLRLGDNPALHAAVATGAAVIPVFIWAPDEESPWPPGSASQWWLHRSLAELQHSLEELGSRLIVRRGPTLKTLKSLVAARHTEQIFWNRRYEPAIVARDREMKEELRRQKITVESFNGSLLFEPWNISTKEGKPFQVFTPFSRACLEAQAPAAPIDPPAKIPAPSEWPESVKISDLALEPEIDWAEGMRQMWSPGEGGAAARIKAFSRTHVDAYKTDRDRPGRSGTSQMSPHLHFGEISPRQIWHAVRRLPSAENYLRQLIWREFANHLLYHYPRTTSEPFRKEFRDFPWRFDEKRIKAWTSGRTGYPIVDAGMRQLWRTGWMHNRVRMVAGSFLVKHLMAPWQEGAAWFWDTLVDADLANNTLGWQWVAGCGADAAPYFRIFNPVLQGEKFDPAGDYVRRWVPELRALPKEFIHKPWAAPAEVLTSAGVKLGLTYALPIVDHSEARAAALDAFEALRRASR